MFQVTNKYPIPNTVGKGRKRKYPFDTMKVGDSFDVGCENGRHHIGQAIQYAVKHYCRGMKFATQFQTEENVIRVWRKA